MPCYHPIDAWRSAKGVFFRPTIDCDLIRLPCGRCIGCRLERSRQWAVRLVHEKAFHDRSSFITLTYDEEHLPKSGSLDVTHFQKFMKRLRDRLGYPKLRFFHAGEYGEQRGRPHYHAIIFGEDFLDGAVDFEESDCGDRTWCSPVLSKLWPDGLNRVGSVTFESCAYVARYVTKKVSGSWASGICHCFSCRGERRHYERVCPHTGEIFNLKPEYMTCSKRPAIGLRHFEKYSKEIFPADEVVSRGHLSKPPKYYDRMLEKIDPEMYAFVKDQRECALSLAPAEERSPQRLHVKETVKLAQIGHLTRRYEIG